MVKRKTKSRSSKKNSSFNIFIIVVIILALVSFTISYFVLQTESETVATSTNVEKKDPVKKPDLKIISKESILQGTWASYSDGAMLTIEGGHFSIELPSVESAVLAYGKVIVENGMVIFIYTNKDSDCKSQGLYKFKIKDDEVTFVAEKDGCKSRVVLLVATWFKV